MTAVRTALTRSVDDPDVLVDRAIAGDHAAFAALYRAHADPIYALLTRLVGPCPEREDLLQDTFVRFHRALPRYRREASVRTFLHQLAIRAAYDHLRGRRRRPAGEELDDELPATVTSPEERAEIAAVLRILDELSPEQRIAFVLRNVMGFTFPEIGDLVGCFATTARMRVNAAERAIAARRRKR